MHIFPVHALASLRDTSRKHILKLLNMKSIWKISCNKVILRYYLLDRLDAVIIRLWFVEAYTNTA